MSRRGGGGRDESGENESGETGPKNIDIIHAFQWD